MDTKDDSDEFEAVEYPFICPTHTIFSTLNQTQALMLSSHLPHAKFDCKYDTSKMNEDTINVCAEILSLISGFSILDPSDKLNKIPGFEKDEDIFKACEKIFEKIKIEPKLFFYTIAREFLYDGVIMKMIANGHIEKGLLIDFVNECANNDIVMVFGPESYIGILTENAEDATD